MKKGRHRRFEEARALKRTSLPSFGSDVEVAEKTSTEPCPECGGGVKAPHAEWCMYTPEDDTEPVE